MMIRPIPDDYREGGASLRARIAELLRDGLPDEPAAREELRGLIARLDPRARRLMRTDPSVARALWLLDLACVRDREARRAAARRRGKQCLIALTVLAVLTMLVLAFTLALHTARKA